MQVTPIEPSGWSSEFNVIVQSPNETIVVKTVDIYTYLCSKCEKVDSCPHTRAVRAYIWEEMTRFANEKKKLLYSFRECCGPVACIQSEQRVSFNGWDELVSNRCNMPVSNRCNGPVFE